MMQKLAEWRIDLARRLIPTLLEIEVVHAELRVEPVNLESSGLHEEVYRTTSCVLCTARCLMWWSQHDLAVDRERLEDDVEALGVLVHECGADAEPKIVLALTLDDGVGSVGGC